MSRGARRALAGWLTGAALAAQAPVAFERQVLPLLEQHCFECHRAAYADERGRLQKPKGGLRLDGRAWIEKGGTNGRVLVPGKSRESELYTRTVLPEDHPDRMPEEGDPLDGREAALLARWIDGGADFGGWTGAPRDEAAAEPAAAAALAAPATRLAWIETLGRDLRPPPAALLERAAAGIARIEPIGESGLLRVEYAGHEAEVDDRRLGALAPIQDQIAILVLARAAITDAACRQIARMPRLVHLDLRETKIGDAGVQALAGLGELRHLNLFATAVTDRAVPSLAKLTRLEQLHVWQSSIGEDGVAALGAALPETRVVGAPALPPPAPPGQAGPRRRR
jgi:hypothetical protein